MVPIQFNGIYDYSKIFKHKFSNFAIFDTVFKAREMDEVILGDSHVLGCFEALTQGTR